MRLKIQSERLSRKQGGTDITEVVAIEAIILRCWFMIIDSLHECNPIIDEVLNFYTSQRINGLSRDYSVEQIYKRYCSELNDEEDRPFVIISVALSLCLRDELTTQARNDALKALDCLRKQGKNNITQQRFDDLVQCFSEDHLGPEAVYQAKKQYDPGWIVGDTFIHAFSQSSAERNGLAGWLVVFRKVGDYLDQLSRHIQLVYVTVCPADSIPKSNEELRALGCLRMMDHDGKYDYLGQLVFKNKKDEEQWALQKIGNFPNAGYPNDASDEDPLLSMPFFGVLHRKSQTPDYEDLVCHLYKHRGINKNLC